MFESIYIDYLLRLAASFICGVFLGWERKSRQHTVGMRTLILIVVSSALLTILSPLIITVATKDGLSVTGDVSRIAAAIVSGIGFLGGGAIVKQGLNIKGITSAAIIWTAAALGVACGLGQYYLAGITLIISLVSLIVLEKFESRFFPAGKTKSLIIEFSSLNCNVSDITKKIASVGLLQKDMNMSVSIAENKTVFKISVKASSEFNLNSLIEKLENTDNLINISISGES